MLFGQYAPCTQAGGVHRDAVDDGVRTGEVDVLERAGGARGAKAVLAAGARPAAVNTTISPGSTSRRNFAPTAASAQLSEATT